MSVNLIKTGEELREAISFFNGIQAIGVDTETSGLSAIDDKIVLLQMGTSHSQYVFDLARLGKAVQLLKPILENPKIIKILHNAKFDYKFLKYNLGIELNNMFDTYLAEQLLQKGRKLSGFSLEVVAEKYASAKLDKSVRETFEGMLYGENISDEQIIYASLDVKYSQQIMIAQKKLLERDGLKKVTDLEMNAIAVTGDMELNGMRIDRTKWLAAESAAKKERDAAMKRLDELLKPYVETDMFGNLAINYNSPKQLLTVLRKAVNPNLESTNENVIKDIAHPVIYALLDYRGFEKQISTYGESFLSWINPTTNRIHTTFDQLNTDTGRYSSKDPFN
jgi:DNA polymerase I